MLVCYLYFYLYSKATRSPYHPSCVSGTHSLPGHQLPVTVFLLEIEHRKKMLLKFILPSHPRAWQRFGKIMMSRLNKDDKEAAHPVSRVKQSRGGVKCKAVEPAGSHLSSHISCHAPVDLETEKKKSVSVHLITALTTPTSPLFLCPGSC